MCITPIFLCLFWWHIYDQTTFPEPTPEIIKLIGKLDDDNFPEREKATKELIKIGRPAIRACENIIYENNPEKTYRANIIISAFYHIDLPKGKLPSLWSLPSKLILQDGKELKLGRRLARYYLRLFIPKEQSWDWETNVQADRYVPYHFVNMLLRNGVSKEDVQKLVYEMKKHEKSFDGLQQHYPWMDWEHDEATEADELHESRDE